MKKMVLLTEDEYSNLVSKIDYFQVEAEKYKRIADCLDVDLAWQTRRVTNLWDALNRPAIEDAEQKGEEDYLSWCDAIANIYFEDYLYEEECYAFWCLYNNVKYKYIEEETEGWTKALRFHDNVLEIAEYDARRRYINSKKGHSAPNEYYRLLAEYFHYLQQSDSITD